jgi:hypothetical protein
MQAQHAAVWPFAASKEKSGDNEHTAPAEPQAALEAA